MKGDKCGHIYANLTMCKSTLLHWYSAFCKRHFDDVHGGTKAAKIQDKRFYEIRKIVKQFDKIQKTIEQIKHSLGYSI